MKRIIVTNFSGPLGYQLSCHFFGKDVVIDGVDQFLPRGFRRAPLGSASYQSWLDRQSPGFMHYELDIAHRDTVMDLIREIRPSGIVHSLPSFPVNLPATDDDLVLSGTRNLLEAAKEFCWLSPFIFLSSNGLYRDHLNAFGENDAHGIPEDFPLNRSPHSRRKAILDADLLVQEYARRFQLPTGSLRSPVPTDPWNPDGALYDPLASLVQAGIRGESYPISARGMKQVRKAIHARDVADFIGLFLEQPRAGEIYNLGGGQENSYCVQDIVPLIEEKIGRQLQITLQEDVEPRNTMGGFSDLRNVHDHYPAWRLNYSLSQIIDELVEANSMLRI